MEGVERYKVRLLTHNPAWATEFHKVQLIIKEAWGENALAIEHVGSTSVPAIPAKPILDVAVMVKSLPDLDIDALTRLGYDYRGYQNPSETRVLFVLRGEDQISLQHIHVCAEGDIDFRRQVSFRDHLNAHPDAAMEYAELKEKLAAEHPDDRAAYTKGKTEFILNIYRKLGLTEEQA